MRFSALLKAVTLAACLLLPLGLWAQSDQSDQSDLAAAAAQAQKDKKDKPKEPAQVFTNDNLPQAPDAMRPTGAPASAPAGGEAPDQAAAPADASAAAGAAPGQPGAAKPGGPVDMKALEDKLASAHRDVDETKNVIQKLEARIPNETGTWRDADQKLLDHAKELLPGYQGNLSQVQGEYDAAKAQSKPGQAPAPGQPAPPSPPPSSPQL